MRRTIARCEEYVCTLAIMSASPGFLRHSIQMYGLELLFSIIKRK